MSESRYDLLISGAGPAGLSTAIFAARAGLSVLVLEKEKTTGVFPRGETLRPDPIVDELLGPSFMDTISLHRTAKRRYWSPGARASFEVEREVESHLFEWRSLTEGLREAAEAAGAELRFESPVAAPVLEEGRCVGLILADGARVEGETMVAADGHRSRLATGVDRGRLDCPIAKRICTGLTTDYEGMEFFFVSAGAIEPEMPAALAFIFPRGGDAAEVGVMLISAALSPAERARPPGGSRMLAFLDALFERLPVFSERVASASWSFQGATLIPMGALHERGMEIPGLALVGDTIGMVEATGGCGIVPSMKNARFLVGHLADRPPGRWSPEAMERYNAAFAQSRIHRSLEKKQRVMTPLMRLGFSRPHGEAGYAKVWGPLGWLYGKV
ncbi:MAG: NAD(P)/FAD-dependent oxidoreductase [Deltaproteobacteria bacterium]|nr:NAD(P)/FAD-dependent oxidoreductase [Deltaproteobacteria bacterium]